MVTGADHYAEAERLLTIARDGLIDLQNRGSNATNAEYVAASEVALPMLSLIVAEAHAHGLLAVAETMSHLTELPPSIRAQWRRRGQGEDT